MEMLLYSGIYLLGVLISSVSQVMLKLSARKQRKGLVGEYLNPLVLFAYALFFLATLMTIYAYKVIPISLGPVLEATSYLYITFFGVVLFKETMGTKKVIALALIIVGIIIFSLGVQ